MKKQKIQFIVILIVLAVLIAATFGMKWYNKNRGRENSGRRGFYHLYFQSGR